MASMFHVDFNSRNIENVINLHVVIIMKEIGD